MTNDLSTTMIDLIRHGEPEGGQKFRGSLDDPLSELGWQQMRSAIRETDRWDAIVSSPMQRCRYFAEDLAGQQGIPLHIEEDLREIGFGAWEGLTAEAINERFGDQLARFWADPVGFTPPEGEPVSDFRDRVVRGFRHWQTELAGKRVLVVCHGGVIRMVLGDVLGVPLERSFASVSVPYANRSRIRVDRSRHGEFRSLLSHFSSDLLR
ncbi:MAG: histidine phosphatase family protein [Gammaproteobacteria bacterium]|nr:MAG: histidine phosphatase family protein [Gammaproteobacteria bacterium]